MALDQDRVIDIVNKVGISVVGQSGDLHLQTRNCMHSGMLQQR